MKSFLLSASGLVATAALLLSPRAADACSPPAPGLTSTIPSGGETYPANAPVVLLGFGLQYDQLTATIDGVAAKVEPAKVAGGSIQVTPTPKPGQKVEITGQVCSGSPSENGCSLSLAYTAGPEDVTPPGAIQKVSFDVHDYKDFQSSGGDCQSSSDLAIYVSIEGAGVAPEAIERWQIDVFDAATGQQQLFSTSATRDGAQGKPGFRLLTAQLAGAALPGGICVEASSYDLAGNKSAPVRQCSPCRFRQDNLDANFSPPTEPTWTPADVVPGGSCDPGGAGGAGGSAGSGGSGQAGDAGSGGSAPAGSGGSAPAGSGGSDAGSGGSGPAGAGGSAPAGAGGSGGSGQAGASGAGTSGQSGAGQAGSGTAGTAGNAGAPGPSVEGTESGDDGGCSSSGRPTSGAAWLSVLLGLSALASRRRR